VIKNDKVYLRFEKIEWKEKVAYILLSACYPVTEACYLYHAMAHELRCENGSAKEINAFKCISLYPQ